MAKIARASALSASLLFLILCLLPSTASAEAIRVVGAIMSIQGDDLVVASPSGAPQHVRLADTTTVRFTVPEGPSSLTQNAFVGATAVAGPSGTLVASEVHIFPEALRGTGEGHRAMDAAAGTTMTNATVKAVAGRPAPTVTTGTMANVATESGERTLTVEYKGGSQVIVVPNGTPIVLFAPSDRSALTVGAHVIVYAERDLGGAVVGQRISVGKSGSIPPI